MPHKTKPLLLSLSLILTVLIFAQACSRNDSNDASNNGRDRHLINSQNYYNQGQYRAAVIEARNSLVKAPSEKGFTLLARIYMDMGQQRSAIELLEKIENKNDPLNILLVEAYIGARKYKSAQTQLATIRDAASMPEKYKLYAAQIEFAAGNPREGQQLLASLLQSSPDYEEALISQMVAADKIGDMVSVQSNLKKLAEIHTHSPRSLLVRAQYDMQKGNITSAEELLMSAVHNIPDTDIITPLKVNILQLLIQNLTNQGRYSDALPFNQILADANPGWQESREKMQTALTQIQVENWSEAENILLALQAENPSNPNVKALLGVINVQKGNFRDAEALLHNTVDPETDTPSLVGASVLAKIQIDQQDEAIAILDEALAAKPDNVQLLSMYGSLAINIPELESKGEAALLKALSIQPVNVQAHQTLSDYYFAKNAILTGVAQLYSAYEHNPEIPELQNFIATRLLQYNSLEAEKFAALLTSSAPDNANSWVIKSLVAQDLQDHATAKIAIQKALKIKPNDPAALMLLALNNLREKRNDQATKNFSEVAKLQPDNIRAYQGIIQANSLNGAEDKIESIFTNYIETKNTLAHLVYVNYLIGRKNLENAQKIFAQLEDYSTEHSLAIEQTAVNLSITQSQTVLEKGDPKAALGVLTETRQRYPDNQLLLVNITKTQIAAQDFANAANSIVILRRAGNHAYATLAEAEILSAQGAGPEAWDVLQDEWRLRPSAIIASALAQTANKTGNTLNTAFFEKWIDLDPGNIAAMANLASLHTRQGDQKSALSLYDNILSLDADNLLALNNAAWFHQEIGDQQRAIELANRAAELAPNNAAILDTVGWIKHLNNDRDGVLILKKALDLAPENKEIQAHYKAAQIRRQSK